MRPPAHRRPATALPVHLASTLKLVDPAHPSVRLRTSPMVWMAASEYIHDPSQPLPLMLPNEPSGYRTAALATLDAHRIPWRIRHVSTSIAFGGVRAALRAGLGIT